MTAAVQSAADTQHAVAAVPTDAEMLFSLMEESVLSAARQRQAPAATLNRKQQRKLAAIVGTLVAVVALIGWSLRGASNPSLSKLPATDRQTEVVAKPGPPMPENIRRLLPGHSGVDAGFAIPRRESFWRRPPVPSFGRPRQGTQSTEIRQVQLQEQAESGSFQASCRMIRWPWRTTKRFGY